MAIFAISDLHLSFASPKPMDIFGPAWTNHAEHIRANWVSLVGRDDIVLMPGDLSWAMRLHDARPDLRFLAELPGKKILIRGNHDYWWNRKATNRIQRTVDPGIALLQGTTVLIDGVGITGTRGWRIEQQPRPGYVPEQPEETGESNSERILRRELEYLEKGLQSIPADASLRIAMLHFPPFDENLHPNEFAHVLRKHQVDILVYGHIHEGMGTWPSPEIEGVRSYAVSADLVDFRPVQIL